MAISQGKPALEESKPSPSERSIHCEWPKDCPHPQVKETGQWQEALSYHTAQRQVCCNTYDFSGRKMACGSQNLTTHSLIAHIDWHLTAGYQLDSLLATHHMVLFKYPRDGSVIFTL